MRCPRMHGLPKQVFGLMLIRDSSSSRVIFSPVPGNSNGLAHASPLQSNPGDDRLSHPPWRTVPWALEGLTSVFGMGTGVAPPV